MRNKLYEAIAVISLIVFTFSGYKVVSTLMLNAKEKKAFESLAQSVEQAAGETAQIQEAFTDRNGKFILPEFADLYKQNNDFFGWLTVDGTVINYPVMCSPGDPQYYLSHAFDKSEAKSGTPFLDSYCSEDGGIYIIYGHHMNNGSMFGSLHNYSSKDYWEKHKTVTFNTIHERGEYEVIAAFLSKVYNENEQGFRYYEYTNLKDKMIFDGFMKQLHENAMYDTGADVKYGDKLLVLSTCNYHTKDGRFVVVARKVK